MIPNGLADECPLSPRALDPRQDLVSLCIGQAVIAAGWRTLCET
jgi:hypothetical protein